MEEVLFLLEFAGRRRESSESERLRDESATWLAVLMCCAAVAGPAPWLLPRSMLSIPARVFSNSSREMPAAMAFPTADLSAAASSKYPADDLVLFEVLLELMSTGNDGGFSFESERARPLEGGGVAAMGEEDWSPAREVKERSVCVSTSKSKSKSCNLPVACQSRAGIGERV